MTTAGATPGGRTIRQTPSGELPRRASRRTIQGMNRTALDEPTLDRFPPNDPREWMNQARGSLARAKTRLPGTYLEDSCFDAQQAAERAVKAVLLGRGVEFPHVHDLAWLLSLLEAHGERIPAEVRKVSRLTGYAMHSRYPNLEEAVSEEEYAETIAIAEDVVGWAERRL